jgi:succinyl-CoA synthetase alpha subunit/citrate synthase
MAVKPDYLLFDGNTQALIFGNQARAVQRMLDFDYLCRRPLPSVAAVIDPAGAARGSMPVFFGRKEILIPVYNNLALAAQMHPAADVLINFASQRSAYQVTIEALRIPQIRTVTIIAEGIPERQAREMIALKDQLGKWIIGPATVGAVVPGAFKTGNAGGAISNLVLSRLHRSGSVGFVSKSGGMLNEMLHVLSQNADGAYEGVAIGGDSYPGSNLLDHLLRYEANPAVKFMVVLGEVGGGEEYAIVEAMKNGRLKKPLVAWVTGTCASLFPGEVQFGHAGAMARGAAETAVAKNNALKEAGARVPASYDDFGLAIKGVYEELRSRGIIEEKSSENPPEIPQEYIPGVMRKPTNMTCTISDESGPELLYAGVPISRVIRENFSVGDVISLLWFKKRLPVYVTEFFDLTLKITADHGPSVSGAHNAIVVARAGKDLTAAVASGVLTIGPRFGGALDDAARQFKGALARGLTPRQFIDEMKARGENIQGIGHRLKSVQNPDLRVSLIKDWAKRNLPAHPTLDFALEVEKLTTSKKNSLILNVDGVIGVLFVDMMRATRIYGDEEIDEMIEVGVLNGLFVLGRSIGFIGHFLDQKRQNARLYRHPTEDVLFMLPSEEEALQQNHCGKTDTP